MSGRRPSIRLNVFANFAGTIWRVAAVYLFVPFYVRILGPDAYGLIAFYAIAMSFLFVAEAGLSAAFAREAARESDTLRLRTLLRSAETALLVLLGAAGTALFLGAELIADRWFSSGGTLPRDVMVQCIRLMPLGLVPQIAISLYYGGLMGQQRQVLANGLNAALTATRSGLVLIPLNLAPEPQTFFVWQILSSLSFLLLFRQVLTRSLPLPAGRSAHASFSVLRSILGYASGMFILSIAAGIHLQLDKLLVSRYFTLDQFGFYALAAMLAQIPALVAAPISAAALPRLTNLVAAQETSALRGLFEGVSYFIAAAAGSTGAFIALFSPEILSVWLSDDAVPSVIPAVVVLLAAGSVFVAIQSAPHHLALAHGHTRTSVVAGLTGLVVSVPLLVALIHHIGMVGAAVPWLAVNAVAFGLVGSMLTRRFYGAGAWRWFGRCALIPLAIPLVLTASARVATLQLAMDTWPALASAIAALMLSAGFLYTLRPASARSSPQTFGAPRT